MLPGGINVSEVWSLYGHLDSSAITQWVNTTDRKSVGKNCQIGVIGPTPEDSSGPHLHFEIRVANPPNLYGPGYAFDTTGWIDPSDFLVLNH